MTRPTVALLHGFTGSGASFREIADALSRARLPFDAPPLLGHGPAADAHGVDSFDGEVDRLARHFRERADSYHLVGYSLGGRLALGLLLRHPELFRGATLISAQPGLTEAAARDERRLADERWCELLDGGGLAAFVDAWERLPLFATQSALPEGVLARQRTERLAHDPLGLASSLRICGLAGMPSYWDRLATVLVPTTLMVGEVDAKFVAIGRAMQALMTRSRLVVVAGAGHNVVLEHPVAVLETILPCVQEAP